jgi:hypothetical protein
MQPHFSKMLNNNDAVPLFALRHLRRVVVYGALLIAGCTDSKPMPPDNPAPLPDMKLTPMDVPSESKQPLNAP